MIDSSGRRGLRSNGTLFDILPVGQVLAFAGGLLIVLFVLSKPEASAGLQWPGRLIFWTLHVGTGLLALRVASWLVVLGNRLPGGTLGLITITGLAGMLVAAPGYLLLDTLFDPMVADPDPEPVIDGWLNRLIAEVIQVAPWFLVCWYLINLPVLVPPPRKLTDQNDFIDQNEATGVAASERVAAVAASGQSAPVSRLALAVEPANSKEANEIPGDLSGNPPLTENTEKLPVPQIKQKFLLSLPGILGTDLVAVSSDLHYLNVWTVAGRTTVLGSLRDVAQELGDSGMQIHRSHWVSYKHVRRVVGNSREAACILSNDLRVPVSRRRWKTVREQFGKGVVHAGEADQS